ncbi:hypothetical protein HMN09_00367600 [Mycena chlorophos]|uniref:F-box domain-containing protein n=1 Tax=Mycena chlorophos TaxID=658473 RepID=A0A8H6WKZ7_MYCCL|nr:hypothetical protein HMN09_00367600 [Mycena chlorophos]
MHPCLEVPEIISEIVKYGSNATLAILAQTCRAISEPALDSLWRHIEGLYPLLRSFPVGLINWEPGRGFEEFRFAGLARGITAGDWERPLLYCSRVRSFSHQPLVVVGGHNELDLLYLSLPAEVLFPRLRSLVLNVPYAKYGLAQTGYIRLLSGGGLQSLTLYGNTMSLSLLPGLRKYFGAVTKLDLSLRLGHIADTDWTTISDVVRSLDSVKILHLPCADLRSLLYISSLTTLKHLHLALIPPLGDTALSFPALESLDLSDGPVLALLQAFNGTRLRALKLSHSPTEPQPQADIDALYVLLGTSPSFRNVTTLSHENVHSFPIRERGQPWILSGPSLLALRGCPRLRVLDISPPLGLDVDDSILTQFAKTHKALGILRLSGASRVTLGGVIALAEFCASLKTLEVTLDASQIPPGGPFLSIQQTSLTRFVPKHNSKIEDAFAVASLLSGLFPALESVVVPIKTIFDRDTDESATYRSKWWQVRTAPPTPSNGVIGTYAPTYLCPTSSTWDTASWYTVPAGNYLICTTKATTPQTQCSYAMSPPLNGGLEAQSGPGTCLGSATGPVTTISCALNCPVVGQTSLILMENSISGTTTTCYYGGTLSPVAWFACQYSNEGGLLTTGSTTICPGTLTSGCPGPTNSRRRYRREDNMTALLRKKAVDVEVRRALE